ncbi:NF-kappa-B inhibitor 1 isoform B [Micractinium conductrix]|uniref:NF-kappa-B inhibitor-like protein 1 n=1 Tax=Micractinium conductrix TaxID=554055 RepID=A0A2P6VG39_9CHLO|nr:NF-kappa-B inhibitor 1 isoform B [Micractinium conductrix]|eukprot:PSC73049.1 NF-kappa-B inhibitor 1 isoform B [Micractinium conductrix]
MGTGEKRKRHKKERHRDKERHKKQKKKRRRRSRSRSSDSSGGGVNGAPPPSPRRLLLAAALGDKEESRQLLRQGADVAYADAQGTTALHEACRHGHLPLAKLLLRRGGDAGLGDCRGDTPAHLAARQGHLDLLSAMLQADHPPEIEAVNARGESIQQLARAAMDRQDVQSFQRGAQEEVDEWQQQGEWGRGYPPSPQRGGGGWDWQRLADELRGGEQEDGWGAYGGGDWHADQYETAEEYAQRIWEEMQAHRRAKQQQQRATFSAARRKEEVRRAAYTAAAEAASTRILEDQKAQDGAWREAVAAGQAGTKRASYEARWQFFASKHPEAVIAYADVPWILPAENAPQEELQRVLLYGADGPEEQRRRLRTELIRWHPDKFQSKFGRRLAPADAERITARVVAVSQMLNAIGAAVQQQRQQQQ